MDERILQARDEILKGILANKQELVKKYGNKAEQIAYASAMKKAKAQFKDSSKLQEYLNSPSIKFSIIDKLLEQYIPEPDIWDYEPTYKEIEDFEKHQANIQLSSPKNKDKYTGKAEIQVKIGKDKWEKYKEGSVGLIKSIYNKLPNKFNYRIRYEVE